MTVSLCIPRLPLSFNKEYIRHSIAPLHFGTISHIYLIRHDSVQKAFIYYNSWHDMPTLEKLLNGEHINIVHSFPWFWRCSLNKNRFSNKHWNTDIYIWIVAPSVGRLWRKKMLFVLVYVSIFFMDIVYWNGFVLKTLMDHTHHLIADRRCWRLRVPCVKDHWLFGRRIYAAIAIAIHMWRRSRRMGMRMVDVDAF